MIYAGLCAAFGLCVNAFLFARAAAVAQEHELTLQCITPFGLCALFAGTLAQAMAGSRESGAHAAATILLISLVMVCAVTDAQTGYVFDALTVPSIAILLALALPDRAVLNDLLGIAATGGALAFLYVITRGRGLGLGDVKLAACIGCALGAADGLLTLGIAFAAGGTYAAYLLLSGRGRRGDALRFAPYLACATVAAVMHGVIA